MGRRVQPEDLRELLATARKLRSCAGVAFDVDYTDMFIRAATALEERALQLAFDVSDFPNDNAPMDIYPPVNIIC